MTTILEMRGVEKRYGTGDAEVVALSGIELSVAAGELVAVMGPSGSGKSTLLNLAGGLDVPTSGTVSVGGRSLADLSPTDLATVRRRNVGYVFQRLNLIPSLTALENVMLPLELDGIGRDDTRQAAIAALADAGFRGSPDRFPDDLAGDEQQRVAIARAVVGERTLLLADEPTGALDTATGEQVLELLSARARAGAAVVLVTHEPRFASYADRVVLLRDGRPVESTVGSAR
jgi:putative ABC transport system ATP-binding protein